MFRHICWFIVQITLLQLWFKQQQFTSASWTTGGTTGGTFKPRTHLVDFVAGTVDFVASVYGAGAKSQVHEY